MDTGKAKEARIERVALYVTPKERDIIRQAAEGKGVRMSQLCVMATLQSLLAESGGQVEPTVVPTAEEIAVEVARILVKVKHPVQPVIEEIPDVGNGSEEL